MDQVLRASGPMCLRGTFCSLHQYRLMMLMMLTSRPPDPILGMPLLCVELGRTYQANADAQV